MAALLWQWPFQFLPIALAVVVLRAWTLAPLDFGPSHGLVAVTLTLAIMGWESIRFFHRALFLWIGSARRGERWDRRLAALAYLLSAAAFMLVYVGWLTGSTRLP